MLRCFLFNLIPCVLCLKLYLIYTNEVKAKTDLLHSYTDMRKKFGNLSCRCTGIGPTGGFCLSKEKVEVGGNSRWCPQLASEFRRIFNGKSVYDFGAGMGWYGRALTATQDDGYKIKEYSAFDGAENVDDVFPDGFVKYLDLSQLVHLPKRDWILSLEVGEHIPVQYERNFLTNLHMHNKEGLILSWGIEGK